jgi:hypothetical protein
MGLRRMHHLFNLWHPAPLPLQFTTFLSLYNYLIRYHGQDIDPLMVACANSSLMLYGLNTYSLQLESAVMKRCRRGSNIRKMGKF